MYSETFTITFGDQAENHVGMQKLGVLADEGFSIEDLERAGDWFSGKGAASEMFHLNSVIGVMPEDTPKPPDAYVLIVRKGLDIILGPHGSDDFFREQEGLEKDKKAFMYGRVVNKHARHNLCFAVESQEPSYETGKGRIIAFNEVPLLEKVRNTLPEIIGDKAADLMAEANYYYDLKKCGIGFHGDAERRIVCGVRIGASLDFHYQWFHQSSPVGERIIIPLHHGDIYFMSEKAVGTDWRKKKIMTLRHATGCKKFTEIK